METVQAAGSECHYHGRGRGKVPIPPVRRRRNSPVDDEPGFRPLGPLYVRWGSRPAPRPLGFGLTRAVRRHRRTPAIYVSAAHRRRLSREAGHYAAGCSAFRIPARPQRTNARRGFSGHSLQRSVARRAEFGLRQRLKKRGQTGLAGEWCVVGTEQEFRSASSGRIMAPASRDTPAGARRDVNQLGVTPVAAHCARSSPNRAARAGPASQRT